MKLKINPKKIVTKRSFTGVISALALCISLGTVVHQEVQAQGLQRQLDSVFGSMSNATAPGLYETKRRGVISSGRFTMKNKIFNENIVSFSPPSFSGSCAGIDIFGGAFSFINSEQLIALLRAIASNAAAMAFQVALNAISPDIASIVSKLQASVQALNEFMGNSCQLAKGIVSDSFEAFGVKTNLDASFTEQSEKLVSSVFNIWNTDGKNPGEKAQEQKESGNENIDDYTGNMVWDQLKKQGVEDWYIYPAARELSQSLMSLSGTIIVHPYTSSPDSPSGSSTPATSRNYLMLTGNLIKLHHLIEGGTVQIYDCSRDVNKCMIESNSKTNVTLKGLKTQIEEIYLGKNGSKGFIESFLGQENISDSDRAFIANLPNGVHEMIRNLSLNGNSGMGLAKNFIREKSGSLALVVVYEMAKDLLQSVNIALSSEPSTWTEKIYPRLDQTHRMIDEEYKALVNEYGPYSELMNTYNQMIIFDSSNKFVNYQFGN